MRAKGYYINDEVLNSVKRDDLITTVEDLKNLNERLKDLDIEETADGHYDITVFCAYNSALVPYVGEAPTLGGELVRSAMHISYRFYNDGDQLGCDTVSEDAEFLIEHLQSTGIDRLIDRTLEDVVVGFDIFCEEREHDGLEWDDDYSCEELDDDRLTMYWEEYDYKQFRPDEYEAAIVIPVMKEVVKFLRNNPNRSCEATKEKL